MRQFDSDQGREKTVKLLWLDSLFYCHLSNSHLNPFFCFYTLCLNQQNTNNDQEKSSLYYSHFRLLSTNLFFLQSLLYISRQAPHNVRTPITPAHPVIQRTSIRCIFFRNFSSIPSDCKISPSLFSSCFSARNI